MNVIMEFRDRVVELRRVPAAELRANAKNWRIHPPAQRAALQKVLGEVGFAGALLARVAEDGGLELIDGHLRAELSPSAVVPVLVLDVDATEADRLLATFDTITGQATIDEAKFAALQAELERQMPALQSMLACATREEPLESPPTWRRRQAANAEIPESYELVVTCRDEADQRQLYERLAAEGYACRVLTM